MKKVIVLMALCFALCNMSFASTGAIHQAPTKVAYNMQQKNGKHRHKHHRHHHLHHRKRHM